MMVNGQEVDAMGAVYEARKRREENELKLKQEIERLKIRIMVDWKQAGSSGFWKKCFKYVPFKIIKKTHQYILYLDKTGYPVANPPGLFVTMLKKQGHFPFKEVIKDEPISS